MLKKKKQQPKNKSYVVPVLPSTECASVEEEITETFVERM